MRKHTQVAVLALMALLVLQGCATITGAVDETITTAEEETRLAVTVGGARGEDVRLALTTPAFVTEDKPYGLPLRITDHPDPDKGAIFFETPDGVTWLRGVPLVQEEEGHTTRVIWDVNGRRVTMLAVRDRHNIRIRFSAMPGDDIVRWGMNIAAQPDEYFTGLFERTVDGNQKNSWAPGIETGMNLRGETVDMFVKPTLGLYCPFYLSSKGYGLFVEGTWPGHYDFCKTVENLVQVRFEGPDFAFQIFTSKEPAEIVKMHSRKNMGPAFVPPKWAFMPWRWRDNHHDRETYYDGTPVSAPYNSEVVEDILMMEHYGIPCGVYWVDRPWATGPDGYDDFEWDRDRLPNPEAMLKWLETKDIRFMLWIAPWVMGDMADTALERGYAFNQVKEGVNKRVLLDFSNPAAVEWWQEEGPATVLRQGVKGFKLDRAEEIVPSGRDQQVYDGRTAREMHNDYPVEYLKATYDIAREIHGSDFVLMPRAGYTGSPQYGVFWGGDIGSPAEGLRAAIIAQLRCAVIGYPIWGSDTCGYWQGELTTDTCARWLQFSCFSPLMEVGPTEDRGFWDMKTEPYYNAELIAVWRTYARIHADLADYSYACAQEARRTGMPIARPLFLAYPEQQESWENWQTFLYGPDILVAPIWEPGKRTRTVFLPRGERWVDAWNPQHVYGGGYLNIDSPLHKIPIFVRQGSKVDLGDLTALHQESQQRAADKPDLKKLEETVQLMQVK